MRATLRRVAAICVALLAVTYLAVMTVSGALPERRHRITFEAEGVMVRAPEYIVEVALEAGGKRLRFTRRGEGWIRTDDGSTVDKGTASSLSRAVKFMHTSDPVRVFTPQDLADSSSTDFGLTSPRYAITLSDENTTVLEARFGDMNADGFLQYMRVGGQENLFLMSRFVGAQWAAVVAAENP